MEIRQLVTFQTVASTLNFSRAAAALNYVPSNVTMQMQALEEELGVRLVDRLGKQLVLTDAGKQFLQYVEKTLETIEEARTVIADSGGPLSGTVTISANEVLCAYRLPRVFRLFKELHPGVRIVFRPLPNDELKPSLYDGKTDVVFLLDEPVHSKGLAVESLVPEPFGLFVSPSQPLLSLETLETKHFDEQLFLLTAKGCTYRTVFDRALNKVGTDSNASLEFSSAEAIKQCAIAGIGIAFLPEIAVEAELARGELVPLSWQLPDIQISTQMVWHKEKWLSPAITAFLSVVRETINK